MVKISNKDMGHMISHNIELNTSLKITVYVL